MYFAIQRAMCNILPDLVLNLLINKFYSKFYIDFIKTALESADTQNFWDRIGSEKMVSVHPYLSLICSFARLVSDLLCRRPLMSWCVWKGRYCLFLSFPAQRWSSVWRAPAAEWFLAAARGKRFLTLAANRKIKHEYTHTIKQMKYSQN